MVIQLSCFIADIELKSFKLTTIFLLENIVSMYARCWDRLWSHNLCNTTTGLELFSIDLLLWVHLRTLTKFSTFYVTEKFITVFTSIHPFYSSMSNMMSVSCVAALLLFSIFIKKITCMILKYLPLYNLRLYVELFYCCSSLINSHCHHVGIDDDRVYKEFWPELIKLKWALRFLRW